MKRKKEQLNAFVGFLVSLGLDEEIQRIEAVAKAAKE
jgi:hypothetical protein